jgi:hypothetical protein
MVKLVCVLVVAALVAGTSVDARDIAHVRFRETPEHSDSLKLRLWLWQRWSAHRAATATVEWLTVEGDSGASDYTIAKDRDGVWYLSIHFQGSDRFAKTDAEGWRDQWTIAYTVERVQKPYRWDWPGKSIAHSRPLPARKFELELKDKQGKLLTHI